jgi:hypothetical protein
MLRARRWEWLVLAAAAFAYLVVLLARLRDLMAHNALNADSVSAPLIGELLHRAPDGREVLLGNFPWYQQLWFEQATRWAPAHRQLWELFPFGVALVAVALATWAVFRVAGRWAAAITGVALFCASAPLITNFFQGTTHSPTSAQVALLGATAVWLATRPSDLSRGALISVIVVSGGLTAIGVASDQLLYAAGIVPFAVAAIALWRLVSLRSAIAAAGVVAVGVAGGLLLKALMHGADYRIHPLDLKFAADDKLFPNARLGVESIAYLGNGDFWGQPLNARGAFALLCCALVLVAAWAVIRMARAWALERAVDDPARVVLITFWGVCAIGTAAVFVLSTAPVDILSSRYLVPAWFALCSLVPLMVLRWPPVRVALTLGVTVLAVASTIALARGDATDNLANWPDGALQGQLRTALQAEGLKVGYAGYWDAAPITWGTHQDLEVYPVWACDGAKLCRFYFHNISSWYTPRPNTKTYLVVDPAQPLVAGPDPAMGKPLKTLNVGRLQVYVYDHDIASELGPAPAGE